MGTDKASLVVGGLGLADRAAAVLRAVCTAAVEVGPGHTDLVAVREVPPGSGPLPALVAGWRALGYECGFEGRVIALACDMPGVTVGLVRLLAEHPAEVSVVPVAAGLWQPLCARYAPEALAVAEELVAAGARSMQSLLERVTVVRVHETEWSEVAGPDAFSDLDSPVDLGRLGGQAR